MKATKILNDFLTTYGFDCSAVYIPGEECYYDDDECKITMGDMSVIRADELFVDYCKSLGLVDKYSIDTLSFFHELGHFETLHTLTEEEEIESDVVKMFCATQEIESDENFMAYFTCPVETIATEWAVDFLNENSEICHIFDEAFQEVIDEGSR